MRVSSRSRGGQPERRNPANESFRATKKAPAPPVCRPVDQLDTAELPHDEWADELPQDTVSDTTARKESS